jgi:excisionase family DNA binding protein
MNMTVRGEPMSDLLLIPEAAAYLRVTRQQVYNLINAGDLPTVKVGSVMRIRLSDIEAYLRRPAS